MRQLLDFETDIEPIEAEMEMLRRSEDSSDGDDILKRLRELKKKKNNSLKKIYDELTDWQVCQVARHPARPQAMDYIHALCTDFVELHGDRCFADDKAVITGLATFEGLPVAVIGQQKGHTTSERLECNFGMARPEGYRKALRIMELAEKFSLPLLSFVDTPGAYPGIGAEERGQSGAIGICLQRAATLRTPILVLIIGEGGSGGALAFAVGDYVGMLRYAIYSVISPEGCASILWKDASRTAEAAALLGLTAAQLKKLHLIDDIIEEPIGGAHRHADAVFKTVSAALNATLEQLRNLDMEALLETRRQRWRHCGKYLERRK